MNATQMLSDDRRIWRIEFLSVNGVEAVNVLTDGVVITCYGEPSEYCDRPWFLVEYDDGRVVRVNGNCVASVSYMGDKA